MAAKERKERKTGSFFVFLAFFCGNSGGMHEVQLKAEKPKVCKRRAHLHFSAFLSRISFSAFQLFSLAFQLFAPK
jgi:hypothetical protein